MNGKWLLTPLVVGLLLSATGLAQVPKWTVPQSQQVRIIIVSDAAVEADDPAVIAYSLLSPTFAVQGIVASHFTVVPFTPVQDATDTMEASYRVAGQILDMLKQRDCVTLRRGARISFTGPDSPPDSEGADLIVDEAMKKDNRPLYVLLLGAATDMAVAYRKQPRIAQHLTVVWIAGSPYPEGGPEYNLSGDLIASRILMDSDLPIWQIPSSVYMKSVFSLAEAATRMGAHGPLGRFLFNRVTQFLAHFPAASETWQYADLPAAAVLLQQSWANDYEERPAPTIGENGAYQSNSSNRRIRVYRSYDHRVALEDLYAKVAGFARGDLTPKCPVRLIPRSH